MRSHLPPQQFFAILPSFIPLQHDIFPSLLIFPSLSRMQAMPAIAPSLPLQQVAPSLQSLQSLHPFLQQASHLVLSAQHAQVLPSAAGAVLAAVCAISDSANNNSITTVKTFFILVLFQIFVGALRALCHPEHREGTSLSPSGGTSCFS